MNFYLVFWKNKTTSIVDETQVIFKPNGSQEAQWNGKYFPMKILRESDDKNFLESLVVTTSGEVYIPQETPKTALIAQSREKKAEKKHRDMVKSTSIRNLEQELFNCESIFEKKDDGSRSSLTNSSTANKHVQTEPLKCPFLSASPLVKEDSMNSILQLLKRSVGYFYNNNKSDIDLENSKILKPKEESHPEKDTYYKSCDSSKMVELIPGSKVLISNDDLFLFNAIAKNEPKEMVRFLLRSIVGEENLMRMTLSGKGKQENMLAIPKEVLVAVERHVQEKKSKTVKFCNNDYKHCITTLCNSLRQTNKLKQGNRESDKDRQRSLTPAIKIDSDSDSQISIDLNTKRFNSRKRIQSTSDDSIITEVGKGASTSETNINWITNSVGGSSEKDIYQESNRDEIDIFVESNNSRKYQKYNNDKRSDSKEVVSRKGESKERSKENKKSMEKEIIKENVNTHKNDRNEKKFKQERKAENETGPKEKRWDKKKDSRGNEKNEDNKIIKERSREKRNTIYKNNHNENDHIYKEFSSKGEKSIETKNTQENVIVEFKEKCVDNKETKGMGQLSEKSRRKENDSRSQERMKIRERSFEKIDKEEKKVVKDKNRKGSRERDEKRKHDSYRGKYMNDNYCQSRKKEINRFNENRREHRMFSQSRERESAKQNREADRRKRKRSTSYDRKERYDKRLRY